MTSPVEDASGDACPRHAHDSSPAEALLPREPERAAAASRGRSGACRGPLHHCGLSRAGPRRPSAETAPSSELAGRGSSFGPGQLLLELSRVGGRQHLEAEVAWLLNPAGPELDSRGPATFALQGTGAAHPGVFGWAPAGAGPPARSATPGLRGAPPRASTAGPGERGPRGPQACWRAPPAEAPGAPPDRASPPPRHAA